MNKNITRRTIQAWLMGALISLNSAFADDSNAEYRFSNIDTVVRGAVVYQGQTLVYGDGAIYAYDEASNTGTKIFNTELSLRSASVTPDGSKIVFGTGWGVYVYDGQSMTVTTAFWGVFDRPHVTYKGRIFIPITPTTATAWREYAVIYDPAINNIIYIGGTTGRYDNIYQWPTYLSHMAVFEAELYGASNNGQGPLYWDEDYPEAPTPRFRTLPFNTGSGREWNVRGLTLAYGRLFFAWNGGLAQLSYDKTRVVSVVPADSCDLVNLFSAERHLYANHWPAYSLLRFSPPDFNRGENISGLGRVNNIVGHNSRIYAITPSNGAYEIDNPTKTATPIPGLGGYNILFTLPGGSPAFSGPHGTPMATLSAPDFE